MTKPKIVSALGLYITFLFIGHHGPFAFANRPDDHPHTHKKHTVKLLRTEENEEKLLKLRKYVPLTS